MTELKSLQQRRRRKGYELGKSGEEFMLSARWPQASHFVSLNLSFLITISYLEDLSLLKRDHKLENTLWSSRSFLWAYSFYQIFKIFIHLFQNFFSFTHCLLGTPLSPLLNCLKFSHSWLILCSLFLFIFLCMCHFG